MRNELAHPNAVDLGAARPSTDNDQREEESAAGYMMEPSFTRPRAVAYPEWSVSNGGDPVRSAPAAASKNGASALASTARPRSSVRSGAHATLRYTCNV